MDRVFIEVINPNPCIVLVPKNAKIAEMEYLQEDSIEIEPFALCMSDAEVEPKVIMD